LVNSNKQSFNINNNRSGDRFAVKEVFLPQQIKSENLTQNMDENIQKTR